MSSSTISYNRRKFLKATGITGGGLLLNFSWLAGQALTSKELAEMPAEWFELNSYVKIAADGSVTLYSANPEFGS